MKRTYFHIITLTYADKHTDIIVLESDYQSNVRAANHVWKSMAEGGETMPYDVTAERAKKADAIEAVANGARDWTFGE